MLSERLADRAGVRLDHAQDRIGRWCGKLDPGRVVELVEEGMAKDKPMGWIEVAVRNELKRRAGEPEEPSFKPMPKAPFLTRCATLGFGGDRMGKIGWQQYEHIEKRAEGMSDAELEAALSWCEVHGLTWRQGVMAEARVA